MKVLMFGWEFPPHNSGGLGTACLGLSRALIQQGIDLTIVLPKKLDGYSSSLKIIFPDEKLRLSRCTIVDSLLYPYVTPAEYRRTFLMDNSAMNLVYGGNLFDEVRRYALKSRYIAKNERFDIIHAHDWLAFGAGIEAKDVSKKKLVVHVHATEFDRTGGNGVNQNVYKIEREGMHRSDAIIAVSNFTKNTIVRHYGVSPEKIQVVYNSVNESDCLLCNHADDFKNGILPLKKLGYKLVVFVGRITLQKGLDYFLNAAKIISKNVRNALFAVVGSGDMERQMINESARLGIADKVIFAGFLRGFDLSRIYHSADLFIMPSVSEPFGLTALEALLHGAPVLISKQSGVSEVLSHALKVDFWDTEEMANKAVSVLKYDSIKSCLSDYGREEMKRYTWNDAGKKCIEIYNNI